MHLVPRGGAGTESTSGDELEPSRPQVALIVEGLSFARSRERLAGAGPGPDGSVIGPSGESQGAGPATDTGEEMELGERFEVIRGEITDIAGIDDSGGDVPLGNQLAQPSRRAHRAAIRAARGAERRKPRTVPSARAGKAP